LDIPGRFGRTAIFIASGLAILGIGYGWGPVPAASASPKLSCSLVSPVLISATLGVVVRSPHVTRQKNGFQCGYFSASGGPGVTIMVLLHQTKANMARDYQVSQATQGQKTTRLSGIGDSAILVTVGRAPSQLRDIVVLDGKTIFGIIDLTYKSSLVRDEALAKRLVPLERT
jgi:hypothetical protein